MSRIELILAGAGTGKTTRLAKELGRALVEDGVRPEAVLATTFTRQAAAELAERARTRLLATGRPEDAHRLQAARIGTVNAVCGRLVEEFAFELGLSPDVRVIDEALANQTLREALSTVATTEEHRRLGALSHRMVELEWEMAVARVVAAARSNGLNGEGLAASREQSETLARGVLADEVGDGDTLDAALVDALQTFVDTVPPTKATDKAALAKCRGALSALRQGRALPWRDWSTLSTLKTTVGQRPTAALVQQAAAAHDAHPRFAADILAAIELVFTLAARTLDAYEAKKREWGVIDFGDQEAYALELLGIDTVAERLRGEVDLVLVDEFQDTSPLQLAIFLRLAEIAPRSIWVGDQKQSIFGFRGTDPDLMNAALELLERRDPAFVDDTLAALFDETKPTTLSESWRSRPALVELTSELFAQAFGGHGIPRDRVVLSPGYPDEAAGLGPVVEVWDLQLPNASRTRQLPSALAGALDGWLADPSVAVRSRATGDAVGVRLSDVAVLSRRRSRSLDMAEALEGLGHRVVLPRPGLLSTAEGRLAMAALRRWADPSDHLAAVEIARITEHPTTPDAWLQSLPVGGARDTVCPACAALDGARDDLATCDPTTALDHAVGAVGLRALCRGWGESRQRLGNLDALRSMAEAYVTTAAAGLSAASVPGLLAYLEAQADAEQDMQAVLAGDDAITLSTWHAAKGLEWPVTILFDLEWGRLPDVTGVEVEPGVERIDLRDPLANRWIRYLPAPYQSNQRKTAFIVRASEQPFAARAAQRHEREQLRLLYVAWTRARDRLILAGPVKKLYTKILASLKDDSGPLLSHPSGTHLEWVGHKLPVGLRESGPSEPRERSTQPGHSYPPREAVEHPPAWRSPSSVQVPGSLAETIDLGPAIKVPTQDPQAVGEAVHAFFGADDRTHSAPERLAFAVQQLAQWGLTNDALAHHLVASADALHAFIDTRWPGATVRRELPIWHKLEAGTTIRGTADLIVETPDTFAVIDHKAMLGPENRVLADVRGYAGQLATYAAAIEAATGKTLSGCFAHLPLSGKCVRFSASDGG